MDDLRTTNQIGNGGLQSFTPATSSSMAATSQPSGFAGIHDLAAPDAKSNAQENVDLDKINDPSAKALAQGLVNVGTGLDKIGDNIGKLSKSTQQGVMLSNKTEPDIIGFNNDAIAKFIFESGSVLSTNDDHIILDDEFIGREPGSLNSQLFQIKLPEWISEKIKLPINAQHRLNDYRITLLDPGRSLPPLEIRFADALPAPKDFTLNTYDMSDPTYVKKALAAFRKLKAHIDAESQKYFGSIDCVSSLTIEEVDYDHNNIKEMSLVVTFPARTARLPNKLVGTWGPHSIISQDYPRYMATTPLVAELRRQVAEVERTLMMIQQGWVGRSRDKHDVPSNACYKLCSKDCNGPLYVWVCPEGKAAFEEFTIAILELSTVIKNVNLSGSTGVKFTPGSGAPTLGGGK